MHVIRAQHERKRTALDELTTALASHLRIPKEKVDFRKLKARDRDGFKRALAHTINHDLGPETREVIVRILQDADV